MSKEQEMFALIDEFQIRDLNGRDFCKVKGLVPSTFYYWKKKKARIDTGSSTGFVTIGSNSTLLFFNTRSSFSTSRSAPGQIQ